MSLETQDWERRNTAGTQIVIENEKIVSPLCITAYQNRAIVPVNKCHMNITNNKYQNPTSRKEECVPTSIIPSTTQKTSHYSERVRYGEIFKSQKCCFNLQN